MEIISKTNDGLRWRYNISISCDEVNVAVMAALVEKAKTVKLDGFRPGKAPVDVVRRLYGDTVKQKAIDDLVTETADFIIGNEQLNICFNYFTDVLKNDESGVEFALEFDLMPEVELKDFSSLELTKYQVDVSDEEANTILENIKSARKKWTEADPQQEIQLGYKVSIGLEVKQQRHKKGKNDTIQSMDIVVGEHDSIHDFWQPLVGAKLHDVREFVTSYPVNDAANISKNKDIACVATVRKVMIGSDYSMDDEFAQSIGFDNLSKAKEWAYSSAEEKYKTIAREIMHRQLLEKLSDMYDG
ncbi:MAG: trigger factor, partial [Holosporaceae bacterium]|nr:trigger factor [Holosporaceae bacterium]